MHNLVLSLPDDVYAEAQRAAASQGYQNVDAYVAELIAQDAKEDDAPLSEESLRAIAQARAEFAAGQGLTIEQVQANLAAGRAEWLRANPR